MNLRKFGTTSFGALAFAVAITIGSTGAQAGLIGDDVNLSLSSAATPQFDAAFTTTVTADSSDAVVFSFSPWGNMIADISGTGLTMTWDFVVTGDPGDIFSITSLDWSNPDGTLVGLDIVTNQWGIPDGQISFTEDSITVDFGGGFASAGAVLQIDFIVENEVPEPGILGLLGLGLFGVGVVKRRKSRA